MDFIRAGQAIHNLRIERGLTQEQLADQAGITSNTVSRIERGIFVPALPTFVAICNALNTTADLILSDYLSADTAIRWSALAEDLEKVDIEKQNKIKTILACLLDTL